MHASPTGEGPVLILDSGVGGLSVAAEIRQALPNLPLSYVADNGFFPYGERPAELLVERICRVGAAAVTRTQARLLVVACNTASTLALDALRASLSIPVVGVVPAIKPAANLSTRRVIGLLGTERTVAARYTAGLIEEFARDCRIVAVASPTLVRLAERSLYGEPATQDTVSREVTPFLGEDGPDVVVLACTHFPLLRDALRRALPDGVDLIDSGSAIARRVAQLVGDGLPSAARHELFFLTAEAGEAAAARQAFNRFGFSPGGVIPL